MAQSGCEGEEGESSPIPDSATGAAYTCYPTLSLSFITCMGGSGDDCALLALITPCRISMPPENDVFEHLKMSILCQGRTKCKSVEMTSFGAQLKIE